MNKTVFLGIVATGLMAVGAIAAPAFALEQTTTIKSNDSNTQSNHQDAYLKAMQTNTIKQSNSPTSTTTQYGVGSVQVGITNQNNSQNAAAGNFLSQSVAQHAANFHFSSKTINTSQSAVCAIVGTC